MKIRFLPAAFSLLFVTAHAASGDPAIYPPTISATGMAEVRVRPDFADLTFDVTVRHAELMTARKDQSEHVAKVLAVLRAAGVEDRDLQTSQVNVSTVYVRNDRSDTATVSYYDVSQRIGCSLRDVQKVAEVTTNVLLAGASGVGQATLRVKDFAERRKAVRLQAASAAKAKAVALATELGAKVGKPYSIIEDAPGSFSLTDNKVQVTDVTGLRDDSQPTFAPGMVSITSTVQVVFTLE